MIDKFWDGTTAAWSAPAALTEKVLFSNGVGNAVSPVGNAGFPIVPGTTDMAAMLKSGPVMISDGQPAHWLLAVAMGADGNGILTNDPATGKQVLLRNDAVTKTIGGVVGVFDGGRLNPVASTDTGNQALTALQGPMQPRSSP
jgi:hypothetical protein